MGAGSDLARIEAAAMRARSVAEFLAVVDTIRALDPDAADRLATLVARLPPTIANIGSTLRAALLQAVRASAGYAAGAITAIDAGVPVSTSVGALTGAAAATIVAESAALEERLAQAVATSRALMLGGAPLDVTIAPLSAAATSIRSTFTTSIHRVGNRTVAELANLSRLPTVWVAETDACVDCLAYSGRVADVGDGFPEGLTFARVSRIRPTGAVLVAPPLHPNCRCELEPLGDAEYAEALRREAERSILRGFSLDSESMRTRIEAAQLLLESGVDAPASVIAYAERYVREGRFPSRS